MIIIDKILRYYFRSWKEIRVGMIWAGFMAKWIANQLIHYSEWIRLVAIANRNIEKAASCYEHIWERYEIVDSKEGFDKLFDQRIGIITNDPYLITKSNNIDVILEVTWTINYALPIILDAIEQKKDIILMNAELDSTLWPILKIKADEHWVIYTNVDWDQPWVTMNLFRFVKWIWVNPILCWNIKGLHDPYRNPTTQESFAKKWWQNPIMVTSFADWSKISFEQSVIANATNMSVSKRWMNWITVENWFPIEKIANIFPKEDLEIEWWIVDYVVWADPSPGVFILWKIDDSIQSHYLNLYKLWEWPYYCFYTPYHLCHFEVPSTIARAFLLRDPVITPCGKPRVWVIALAKENLIAWTVIDWIWKYTVYWVCENYPTIVNENLLPLWLAESCILRRDIKRDEAIKLSDVEFDKESLAYKLWTEQHIFFK